jgi:prepilin-type N-terminal cleavage/methylation domain-containing protein
MKDMKSMKIKSLKDIKKFTLTEMLVVIAIMAIMAMMMLPTIAPLYRDQAINASVSRVQGVIMKARSLAAMNNEIYYVAFTYYNDQVNMLRIYQNDESDDTPDWSKLADKPYLIDERIKFSFEAVESTALINDADGDGNITEDGDSTTVDYTTGEDCYFKVLPTGEMIRGDDGTPKIDECISILPSGVNQIVIKEDAAYGDAAKRSINIMMLTGSMYKSDND